MSSAAEALPGLDVGRVLVAGRPWRVVVRADDDRASVPLLLCNGIGVNWQLFAPLMAALPGRALVAFDVPGVGESPPPPAPYTMAGLATQVGDVMSSLGLPVFDVLGVSWGGALAQQLAWQFPDRCRRLVLAATTPGLASYPGRPAALAHLTDTRRFSSSAHAAKVLPEVYGGRITKQPQILQDYLRQLRAPSREGYAYQTMALAGWTSIWWLPLLRQRVLILAGSEDPLVPLANARLMQRLLRHAELHTVADGHLFLHTRAADVGPLIDRFLRA